MKKVIRMKKVGIITLVGYENFGNRLQNYALQECLKQKKCVVTTLNVESKDYKDNLYNRKFIILRNVKRCICKLRKKYNKYDKKRFLNFKKFSSYYLNETKNIITKKEIINETMSYDFLVFGSDQIWSPYNFVPFYISLGIFGKNIKPRLFSYSASFGVSHLPDNVVSTYRNGLENFLSISVREDAGKKIVEDLTKRKDIKVLIDPTLLLSDKQWDKLSVRPKKIDSINGKKIILNYFLGKQSDQIKGEIEKISIENNCYIINVLDKNDPFYTCGPSEFLYLEKNAFLICTDSFHACVFALIYNRPFIVFDRDDRIENISSRIDTLIKKFKLKNRRYNGKEITNENLNHDYSKAYKILELERNKANEFLENILNNK